ncbi:uncharacterized protein Ir51b [Drosophila virilis]|uniref:Ionotropic glutamate receptor C-terminal domain-containing protein n=1 Tax=Drosophila virilis TaxID=7244 RepID=B4LQ09_DROVI|nr:uncharacterized protein LOC6626041 [Drosophila virilis]EDW60332.1 uncharacterized protein Dvir_GJ21417 [Drosophila virilis]
MGLARLLLPLLAAWPQQQPWESHNFSFVQSILERAAGQQRWTNTPIFLSRHVQQERVNHLINWLHSNLSSASYVFDGTQEQPDTYNPLRNHIKNDALSLLFCHSSEELIWGQLDERLRKLRQTRLIVCLAAQRGEPALRDIFAKLWSLQFMHALVLHRQRVYAYTPYPTLSYYRLRSEFASLFPALPHDLRNYVVSTPAENDLPRVFLLRDPRTGAQLIRGFGYRILAEFLRRHNARLHVSNAGQALPLGSSVNMSRITRLIGEQQLDISMHPYVGIDRNLGILSYPLHIAQNCLIVPVRNEIPRFMYLLRPFHWSSWLLLLFAVLYITLALYWLSPAVSGRRGPRAMHSLLEAICQLLFLSTPGRIYAPSVRYFLVALQLSVLGFFVTNWYGNQLSSFLTATLVGEQVDTFEQLIAQQQRILTKHHEVPMLLQQVPPHLVEQVARLVVSVEAGEQVRALLSFNVSYSYPFTVERWEFFALQQQYAMKPIYRYSSVCLGAPVIGYPMRTDSHLESPLKHFIMRIQSIGLFQHWVVSDFNDALKAGYVHLIDNSIGFKALDLDTLRLGWYVLLCGWLLAAVVFACEHRTTCH